MEMTEVKRQTGVQGQTGSQEGADRGGGNIFGFRKRIDRGCQYKVRQGLSGRHHTGGVRKKKDTECQEEDRQGISCGGQGLGFRKNA